MLTCTVARSHEMTESDGDCLWNVSPEKASDLCTDKAHADGRNAMRRERIVFSLRAVGFLRPDIVDGQGQVGQEPRG